MKKLLCLWFAIFACSAFQTAQAQDAFGTFLKQHQLTAVPLLDQQKVIPGAVYTVTSTGSYLADPTKKAEGFRLKIASIEVPKETYSVQKSANVLAKFLLSIGVGGNSTKTFEVEEATLVCNSLDPSDGGDLDALVYTDPDFKAKIRSAINGYGSAELISDVCWATKFKVSESSSKAILAAVNTDLQSCTDTNPTEKPKEQNKDGQNGGGQANDPKAKGESSKDLSSTVAKVVSKDTVGELEKSLTDAVKSALGGASIEGKFCSRHENTVELNAKVPVAIAMKTWHVWACGASTGLVCTNPNSQDDPNQLEYELSSLPNLR